VESKRGSAIVKFEKHGQQGCCTPKGARYALGLAGDTEPVVWSFFAEGANRKELVAARDAPVGRHAEEAFERSGKASYMFRSDTLEIVIAANGAMRGKFA